MSQSRGPTRVSLPPGVFSLLIKMDPLDLLIHTTQNFLSILKKFPILLRDSYFTLLWHLPGYTIRLLLIEMGHLWPLVKVSNESLHHPGTDTKSFYGNHCHTLYPNYPVFLVSSLLFRFWWLYRIHTFLLRTWSYLSCPPFYLCRLMLVLHSWWLYRQSWSLSFTRVPKIRTWLSVFLICVCKENTKPTLTTFYVYINLYDSNFSDTSLVYFRVFLSTLVRDLKCVFCPQTLYSDLQWP